MGIEPERGWAATEAVRNVQIGVWSQNGVLDARIEGAISDVGARAVFLDTLEWATHRIDLMILDVVDRISIQIDDLKRRCITPLLIRAEQYDPAQEVLCLNAGAIDYVAGHSDRKSLAARLRLRLRQIGVMQDFAERSIVLRGPLRMDRPRHQVMWRNKVVPLTATELDLLEALAIRPGFVKTRDQLMDIAYGDGIYVEDRTIDSHIKRLRKKLRRVDPRFAAIETLYGVGYRFVLPDA